MTDDVHSLSFSRGRGRLAGSLENKDSYSSKNRIIVSHHHTMPVSRSDMATWQDTRVLALLYRCTCCML